MAPSLHIYGSMNNITRLVITALLITLAQPVIAGPKKGKIVASINKIPIRKDKKSKSSAPRIGMGSCWENALNDALSGLRLEPVTSLRKDPRCDVRPIKERLFHKITGNYLRRDEFGASANTIRLSRGLQCIDRTALNDLDRRLAGYIRRLSASNESSCREGLAGIANAAILVIDLFPNVRESALQRQFQLSRSAIVQELTVRSSGESGLWCDDHLGSVRQYRRSSGKFRIDPLARMVKTYADDNSALGTGVCRCSQMIENNFLCDRDLPPCLREMISAEGETPRPGTSGSLSGLTGSSSREGKSAGLQSAGGSTAGRYGGAGCGSSNTCTSENNSAGGSGGGGHSSTGRMGGSDRTSMIPGAPGFMGGLSSGTDPMTSFLGQFSEWDLRTMACNQQRMRNFADGLSGVVSAGRCDARTMIASATTVGRALGSYQSRRQDEMSCYFEAAARDRQRRYEVRDGSQVFMNRSCGEMDGGGNNPAPQPSRPANPDEKKGNKKTAETAAERMRRENSTEYNNLLRAAALKRQGLPQNTTGPVEATEEDRQTVDRAIDRAAELGRQANVSDVLNDEQAATTSGPAGNPNRITVDSNRVGDVNTMEHEMFHAAMRFITGSSDAVRDHRMMPDRIRGANGTIPCPDCPDNCSVQDELVNDMAQCFFQSDQEQQREFAQNSCGNPENPIGCESTPDPNSPQGDPLLEAALSACMHSGQPDDMTDYNGPGGAIDSCMYEGDPSCPVMYTGGMRTNFNGPAGYTDPDPESSSNPCPDGGVPVFGLNGLRCDPPRDLGNPRPGPGPDPMIGIGGGDDPEPLPTNPPAPAPDEPPSPDPVDYRNFQDWYRTGDLRQADDSRTQVRWNIDLDDDDDDNEQPGFGSNQSD